MKLKDANGNEVEIPDASLAALSLDALAGVNPHVKALNEKVPGADMKVIKVVDFDAIVSERDRLKTSAGADLTALNDTIKTLSTTVDTLKADNAKLKKDAETAAAKAIEVELDALIAAGKVLPRQKPMLIKLSTIDRAEYDKEIAAAREADPIVHTNTQHGSDGEASTSGPAVRQFDTLVDQIKNKNPKMSYADAIKQAAAENPALAKRRNLELALPVGRGGVAMTQQ